MDQLRSLRVFVQVVAEGSFAGAARTLDLAPAVVTRAISDLEEHLGTRLLNRTTRSLALTEIGEAYLERARLVLAELADADTLANSSASQVRGKLRVLCPPAFAVHQLAKHLPKFRALYPHIGIELETPGPVSGADENFDVSIVSVGQQAMQGDFVARPIASSQFVLCASPTYLNAKGRPQQPDELLLHDGLLLAVAATRRELTLFRQSPDTLAGAINRVNLVLPPAALATSQIEVVHAAALAGLGVGGLPSFVAEAGLRDGRLERVLGDWHAGGLRLYVAIPTRKLVPARTRVFVDFLVQTFGGKHEDPWLLPKAIDPAP